MYKGKLLSIGSNPKINKSDKAGKGYKTAILHLSPFKLSGKNFCPNASKGCIKGCLNTSGHGRFDKTQEARLKRSRFFIEDKFGFMNQLCTEIEAFIKHCEKRALKPSIRLNGTSDIPFENIRFTKKEYDFPCNGENIFEWFPMVQFYDYTKSKKRALSKTLPQNYHLMFSRSEVSTHKDIKDIISSKNNVAVVFKSFIPETFEGFEVIDGDQTDLRFLDPNGFVIGLTAKGQAKKDTTGFVVNN
jgi:hypothetical protein